MKCQNCGSADIVSIQGQNYCLSCGELVIAPKPRARAVSKSAKVVNPPKRRHSSVGPLSAQASKTSAPQSAPVEARLTVLTDPSPSVHPWGFTAKIALAVAVPVGSFFGVGLWLRFDSDLMLYGAVVSVLLIVVSFMLSQSALLYGLAKKDDGRHLSRRLWWSAARGALMDQINLDLICLIFLSLLLISGLAIWIGAAQLTGYLKATFLIAANSLVAWSVIGTLAARRVAVPAVVLGGFSAWSAWRLGWQAYRYNAGHLVSAIAEDLMIWLVVLGAIGTGLAAVGKFWNPTTDGAVALFTGVALGLTLAVVFVVALRFELRLWLTQYRRLVPDAFPGLHLKLVGGRSAPGLTAKPKSR